MLVVSYNQFIANGILIKTYSAFKLNVPRCTYCWHLIKYLIKLKHIFKKLMVPRVFSTSFHSFLDIILYESHNSKFSSIVYLSNNIRLLNQLYYGRYYSKLLFRIILLIWNSCLLFIWVNAWVVEGNGPQNHYYTSCVRITLYPLI